MKFQVMMKDQDPDTLNDAIEDAVEAELAAVKELNRDDREALFDLRCDDARKVASKWFKYGEYLCVEIDTDAGTIAVVSCKPPIRLGNATGEG